MDRTQQIQLIDSRIEVLESMRIDDDQSARQALMGVMLTVTRINQLTAQAQAQAIIGAGAPIDDVLENVRNWLDRLVSLLTQIVEKLPDARSFAISASSNVSVSVEFGPFGGRPT